MLLLQTEPSPSIMASSDKETDVLQPEDIRPFSVAEIEERVLIKHVNGKGSKFDFRDLERE